VRVVPPVDRATLRLVLDVLGPPVGVRVFLAAGTTDMRKGFDGFAAMAHSMLHKDPFSGAVFAFRSKPGAGPLAHILVAKYADHLPLYRQ
jgi:transposase